MDSSRAFDQLVEDPIFVVGASRSGTTWVYDILTSHPQVAGVHESWLFTKNSGLGSLFMEAHWPKSYSGLGRLLEREDLLDYTRDMAKSIMAHAIQPEHRFLVEKSPSHLFAMHFIVEVFAGARFIHVLRDGRDVAVSVLAASKSWVPSWKATFGRSVRTSAKAWKDTVRRAHRVGKELGDRFLEVRYESLRTEPFSNYRRLFDFCDIPYDDDVLQDIFEKTDFDKHYNPNEAGFRRGGRIGDWHLHFNLMDAWFFNYLAGGMLIELGYEQSRFWWLRKFRSK